MRKLVAILAVLAGVSVGHTALACGTEEAPSNVSVNDEADNLFSQATRLEQNAQSIVLVAVSMDRRADQLLARAHELRARANVAGELEQVQMIARSEDLAAQAATAHANAAQQRANAANMRARAKGLREQALRLINGGNRWRAVPRSSVAANTI
jgi:hypothetical protein